MWLNPKIPTSSKQHPSRYIVVSLDKDAKEYNGEIDHHFATVNEAKRYIEEEYGL